MNRQLIIFVKNPIKGNVKTRLAITIGDEEALEVYKKLLKHTLAIIAKTDTEKHVFYADFINKDDLWNGCNKVLQQGNDLGERMKNAFQEIFQNGFLHKAIIIGSDCAMLNEQHIQLAFEKLDSHDVVIGPAQDGGYYLLGMKALQPFLFEEMPWSTSDLLNLTIKKCNENKLGVFELPQLSDLDNNKDWNEQKHLLDAY